MNERLAVPGWMGKTAAWLGSALLLAGLAFFAYAGTYARFWADDYCYSASLKQLGLLPGLVDWLNTSGNRFTTLVAVAISDLFGWQSIRFVPLAVLVLWTGAWIFFLRRLARLLGWEIAWRWLVLLSLAQVYFATLLAPDRLQTIYWRMGTFHYTLPAPLLLINLGLLAGCFHGPCRQPGWTALATALLAFFAAGLSETFAALQTGLALLGVLLALVFIPAGPQKTLRLRLLAAPLAGSLLTMTIMALAPANAWRQAVMPPPDNLLLILPYSLRYGADFVFYSIRGQVIPFAVYAAGVGSTALLAVPAGCVRVSARRLLSGSILSLLAAYALIVCSFAPSAYAGLSYPAGRALMPGSFILLAGLAAAAVLLAFALRQVFRPATHQRMQWIALAVLALACLYPIRAAGITRADIAMLAPRAARWDARHAQILDSLAAGNRDVRARQVDVVQTLEDMGPDPRQWINICAASFYGANSITALP